MKSRRTGITLIVSLARPYRLSLVAVFAAMSIQTGGVIVDRGTDDELVALYGASLFATQAGADLAWHAQ